MNFIFNFLKDTLIFFYIRFDYRVEIDNKNNKKNIYLDFNCTRGKKRGAHFTWKCGKPLCIKRF